MSESFVVYELKSWSEFIESVRSGPIRKKNSDEESYPGQVLYRGHANTEWKLWSPLDRRLVTWVRHENKKPEYWSARKKYGLE